MLETPGKPFRVSPKVLCPRSSKSLRPMALAGTLACSRPKGLPVMMISEGTVCAMAEPKAQAHAKAENLKMGFMVWI